MARQLYCDINGVNSPFSVSISNAHGNATAMATIQCVSKSVDIGDHITVDLGFVDDHGEVFDGYIKTVNRNIPDDSFTITAQDKLVQAADYFIVAASPDEPYNYGKGISAEDLVDNVLGLAGLSLAPAHIDPTHFEFGVNNDVEVNMVSSYDYAKMIADIVTWSLWCDMNGDIHFENRKPYVMTGDSGQVGDTVDERLPAASIATINDLTITNAFYERSEKDIRNRVVVYGEGGIKADEQSATTYDPLDGTMKQILPANFFKSVIVSYAFIGDQALADDIAEYNLRLLNRVTERLSVTCEGNHLFEPRVIITVNEPYVAASGNWYIFGSNLNWNKGGFTADLDLRR